MRGFQRIKARIRPKLRHIFHMARRAKMFMRRAFICTWSRATALPGQGLWHPDAPSLGQVRDAIVAHAAQWKRVNSAKAFTSRFASWGEKLKRAPSGYDPQHPCIEDLKRKDFVTTVRFTEGEACAPDFLDWFTESCRIAAPLMQFLTEAVGLPW
jgi:uncharacterized protein (TIGR02453 family)